MPRYYFHFFNSEVLPDLVGQEVANFEAVMDEARGAASELIAEQIKAGEIVSLSNRIEVQDDGGRDVLTLQFRDLFADRE